MSKKMRIAVNAGAVALELLAVILTMAAVCTSEWQWAYLEQVDQLHYTGLYQKCVLGSRQGPYAPPQWQCTYISYDQPARLQPSMYPALGGAVNLFGPYSNTNQVDRTAFGGEAWRMTTLVLLPVGALFGFLSMLFEVVEICLDVSGMLRGLKVMSGCALGMLILGTICTAIGMIIFARNAQESHNLYVMELTSYAIQQLGSSFYMGAGASAAFFIAMVMDLCSVVLTCITAQSQPYDTADVEKAETRARASIPNLSHESLQRSNLSLVEEQENLKIHAYVMEYENSPTRKPSFNEKLHQTLPAIRFETFKDKHSLNNTAKPLNSISDFSSLSDDADNIWQFTKMSRV